mmetsp:Transcript_352/g.825  ORF Transcript_352/g.825 Transcript_352/m.825 type:complete len:243 (-) Transcript_352:405-1133(-)
MMITIFLHVVLLVVRIRKFVIASILNQLHKLLMSVRQLSGDIVALLQVQPVDQVQGSLQLSCIQHGCKQLQGDLVNLGTHLGVFLLEFFIIFVGSSVGRYFMHGALVSEGHVGSDRHFFQHRVSGNGAAGQRKPQSEGRRHRLANGVRELVASLQGHADELAVVHRDGPELIIGRLAQPDSVEHRRPFPAWQRSRLLLIIARVGGREHGQHAVRVHCHDGSIVAEAQPREAGLLADARQRSA